MPGVKHICSKCGNSFSAKGGNYNKHIASCDGTYKPFIKLNRCKYCDLDFSEKSINERANHSRWCDKNPLRQEYITHVADMRSSITEESIKKRANTISKLHDNGNYKDAPAKAYQTKVKNGSLFHNEKTKEIMREKALSSPHRRLKRKIIYYNGIWLDSSWELEIAKRLDLIDVKWLRPDPLKWIDENGIKHNYFPDFYLPDFNLYLDPKNPHAYKVQEKKIKMLLTQYNNIVIIRTLEECKNFNPK